jgi:hypothetical protein
MQEQKYFDEAAGIAYALPFALLWPTRFWLIYRLERRIAA